MVGRETPCVGAGQTVRMTGESDRPLDGPLPFASRKAKAAKKGSGTSAMLGAAMVAVGEVLEPEKAKVELAQPSDERGDDGLDLDFGHLPNLD